MCRPSQVSARSCCCDYPPPEAEFLDEIQTQSLQSFPHCYSQSPLQHCLVIFVSSKLTQPLTVSQFSYCTLQRRKPYPLPYGLRNPYRNLKSENSQKYAQKPQRNSTFMNSTAVCDPGSGHLSQGRIDYKVDSGHVARGRFIQGKKFGDILAGETSSWH